MRSLNLFILNMHPSTELGLCLQEIIKHSQGTRINVHEASLTQETPIGTHVGSGNEMHLEKADIVFLVLSGDQHDKARAIIASVVGRKPGLPIIILSKAGDPAEILDYLRAGATDHLTPPIRAVDVLPRIWRLMDHLPQQASLLNRLKAQIGLRQLIGESLAFRKVVDALPIIANSDVSVRISGETGTGKELCARSIHYLGPRANRAFLPVNCGAIPSELVENELFGHVRGAFTGANLSHGGLISEANGGTLFLDEIDCLPIAAQSKLLRFVQEKEYRQLGSAKVKRADVRIIAATNTDLEHAVRSGHFRQDLFYRLNIVNLSLPPLRERRDDIPCLARHFLDQSATDAGKQIRDFSSAAWDVLITHDWPGNVRELENVVKRAVIFATGDTINTGEIGISRPPTAVAHDSFKAKKASVVAEFEKEYMKGLLRTYAGNITRAAKAAQKNRRAFWELLRKYDIDVSQYKHISAE